MGTLQLYAVLPLLWLQRLLKMVDGLNFKDFVAFLSAFSAKASSSQKIEREFDVFSGNYIMAFFDLGNRCRLS